ncbi:hypothetical protein AQUCO_00600051v1 [Aquilegia coerulea]|uniref:Uncharacterized protein n=1 Tax=Aquilegia coerulea TaxID=218851 RepID=A0A2G5EMQ0_AQUCA|nr:hypothetical protein AQUCO_00600051v1 [Aquilegia coerulea]
MASVHVTASNINYASSLVRYVLDYNDQMKVPIMKDLIKIMNQDTIRLRADAKGEITNQDVFIPGLLPKIPGRFYYLFGKPIEMKGKKALLTDKESANELYAHIKSDVENILCYLKEKREMDPYRGFLERTIYRVLSAPTDNIPTFEP